MEEKENVCTIGGSVHWYSHIEDSMEIPLKKMRNKTPMWLSNLTTRHMLWENHNWKRHLYPIVHHNTICNNTFYNTNENNLDAHQEMNG